MFFKSKRGISGSSAGTKGVIKGATTQFGEGGFVGKPSFKPMVNTNDRSTQLRVTASYERSSVGRVKFVPIPLPIPSKKQPQQEQIATNKTTTTTKTFAGLYQR